MLHQPRALVLPVGMRTAMSAGHVSRQPWSALSALLGLISVE